ncbi:cation diffusion facilitator family transporter [Candidatus Nitrosocosmicus hydrocola]|uniref:cation diffusion facilitator family transporter n=1 Tax=Candidatus Nitrosocosmicus hydrocola TaxID=1826872 RepID=UPI0011E5DA59|nr:cation transporter [Candidatus Nitrosocosmicus hydrocola]
MVGPGSSKKAIYAALFGNLGIAISKLIAALLTGSTSMWAETYHSFSDTFNQVLLLGLFKNAIEDKGEKFRFMTIIKEFKESKDTAILTVIVEDSAALLGIVIAATALFISEITGNLVYDAIGSLLIGLMLMAFAFFLARENKDLLIGESMSKRDNQNIHHIVSQIPEVNKIISIRSMHLAPEDVLIAIEVSLIDNLDTDTIESVIDNIESKVKQVIPYAVSSKIYVELERTKQ